MTDRVLRHRGLADETAEETNPSEPCRAPGLRYVRKRGIRAGDSSVAIEDRVRDSQADGTQGLDVAASLTSRPSRLRETEVDALEHRHVPVGRTIGA